MDESFPQVYYFEDFSDLLSWSFFLKVIVVNALVGLAVHEYVWYSTRRFRMNMPKVDK